MKPAALKYTLGVKGIMAIVFQSRFLRHAFVNRFEQIEMMCIRQTFQRTLVFAWKIAGAWGRGAIDPVRRHGRLACAKHGRHLHEGLWLELKSA